MKRNIATLFIILTILMGVVSSTKADPISSNVRNSDQDKTKGLIVRAYYSNQEDLNYLASQYDVIEVKKIAGFALILLRADEYTQLQNQGYRVEVDEGKTRLLNTALQPLPGQGTDSIPGFPCYRTVEETYADIETLAANNLTMTELIDIGDSWEKAVGGNPGYDIWALRISNEDPQYGSMNLKPTFFLMAEIHARELVTAEAATRYAEYLLDNYGVDADTTWLLDYFRIFIVTMTNPDGRKFAETGDWWRKNVDNDDGCSVSSSWGVDLNRNYAFEWGCCGGSSGAPCAETYRGPTASSEPETQAIQDFISLIFPDQRGSGMTDPAPDDATGVMVTLHSAAGLVLWPWGWTSTDAPNASQLQTLGRRMAYFNSYTPQQSNDLYTTDGTTDDWSYGDYGIASFTIEMGTDFFESCPSFEGTVYPDNLEVLKNVFKTSRLPYTNPAGPESLSVSVSPAAANPGDLVTITAIANDTRYGGDDPEPTQNIAAARYSIDAPSWITDTVTYPMTASDGPFDEKIEQVEASLDTTGLDSGRHLIYIESMDADDNWGVTSAAFLYVVEPGVSPVIEGYVHDASTNSPIEANISASIFSTTSDPTTGYFNMTVISGTYDMVAEADGFTPAYENGVVAVDHQTTQQDFALYPVCTIFSDDVENGLSGWTPQSPWGITNEMSHSPAHSWTDSPGGNYGINRNITLTSPTIDLSNYSGVSLNFWHTYATEAGWDYGNVEYNTGSGWNTVQTYDGNQSWIEEQLSIPQLNGQSNARIRFRFTSDNYLNYDGWHIDDISISAGGPGCTPAQAPTAEFTTNSPIFLGQQMLFTNHTIGSQPLTYTWNFGDGIGASTEENPSYTYIESGTYTVTLTATNVVNLSTISHPVLVEPIFLRFFLPFTVK